MTKDDVIDQLWESSNHGTRREDVVAAYEAGAAAEREACAKVCERQPMQQHMDVRDQCAAAIRAREST